MMDRPVAASGVVVEMAARRISYRGVPLSLSDREFRVLARLVNGRDRAFSFEEIRRLGWGQPRAHRHLLDPVADPTAPSQAASGGGAGHDRARSELRIPTRTRPRRCGHGNRQPIPQG